MLSYRQLEYFPIIDYNETAALNSCHVMKEPKFNVRECLQGYYIFSAVEDKSKGLISMKSKAKNKRLKESREQEV